MDDKKVKKLNELEIIKKLFNAVTEEDILTQKGSNLYIGDKLVPEEAKRSMISDAEYILNSTFWQVIKKNMQYEANKALYLNSENIDDMIFAKAMLFTIDILEKKLHNLIRVK